MTINKVSLYSVSKPPILYTFDLCLAQALQRTREELFTLFKNLFSSSFSS